MCIFARGVAKVIQIGFRISALFQGFPGMWTGLLLCDVPRLLAGVEGQAGIYRAWARASAFMFSLFDTGRGQNPATTQHEPLRTLTSRQLDIEASSQAEPPS